MAPIFISRHMRLLALILIGFFVTTFGICQKTKIDSTIDFIKSETINGKLDFYNVLVKEGKGKTFSVYDGVAYNPRKFAILLWGQAVKRLGIKSVKKATILWESIYKRKMTEPEKNALKKGFNAKIE